MNNGGSFIATLVYQRVTDLKLFEPVMNLSWFDRISALLWIFRPAADLRSIVINIGPHVKYETPENKSIPHLGQNCSMFHDYSRILTACSSLNPHRYCFATQFGTSSTYPWSSMRGSRGKGSTKHWHLWWQTNSTSARQIRNKAQTQTECFMHFTHCHGSPSPPSKPIFQERNTSKQKCYFWVKAFILEIWYISDIYLSMCFWFRFWLFLWIKLDHAKATRHNRSTTRFRSTPRRWMDDSALLASVQGLPAWRKELQAVCLWSV